MATLKSLVDETTNINNTLKTCQTNLKTKLQNKWLEVTESDKISDLINKIDDLYGIKIIAGDAKSLFSNSTQFNANYNTFKLGSTSTAVQKKGSYRCYAVIRTDRDAADRVIAEVRIDHCRGSNIIAKKTLSNSSTSQKTVSADFENVLKGDVFKFYLRNQFNRSEYAIMLSNGVKYSEEFSK